MRTEEQPADKRLHSSESEVDSYPLANCQIKNIVIKNSGGMREGVERYLPCV